MKSFFTCLLLFVCTFFYAQEITYNGTIYTVKGKEIYHNKEKVTATLTAPEKEYVFAAFKIEKATLLEQKEQEEKLKGLEKKQRKAEKKLKKATKKLKKKAQAEKKLKKAQKKLEKETKRYKRLHKKGGVSTEKDLKYQKKLKGLSNNIFKAKKKLKKL